MKPPIRCAVTLDGHIEATSFNRDSPRFPWRLLIDRRTGEALGGNAKPGTDMFRWLVRAAREHVAV